MFDGMVPAVIYPREREREREGFKGLFARWIKLQDITSGTYKYLISCTRWANWILTQAENVTHKFGNTSQTKQ